VGKRDGAETIPLALMETALASRTDRRMRWQAPPARTSIHAECLQWELHPHLLPPRSSLRPRYD
jgi:hypothetical protein